MTIAIIGGGVSGTLTAFHLVRQGMPARVILIDKRPDFGLGLAYSTPSLRHLLNVPAGKISALPDQPDHFLHWLRENHDPAATEKTFASCVPTSSFWRLEILTQLRFQESPKPPVIWVSIITMHGPPKPTEGCTPMRQSLSSEQA